MKIRRIVILVASLSLALGIARADNIAIGVLSFENLIPSSTTPGINFFDIFNLSGSTFGPFAGSPYASDSLTFQSTTLTVNPDGGSPKALTLGDIGPGELLDTSGNPVIQFPTTDNFTSAILTATLVLVQPELE